MRTATACLALTMAVGTAGPAYAQFPNLDKVAKRIDQAKKLTDRISDQDERAIGEKVSSMLTERFGVYQDQKVTKYVTLVGTVLAQSSARPTLDWKFIVLDTDGVNAYAAPGGIVHITRGALGLIKSEAELAGVLGHELTHVTEKHTIKAIEKNQKVGVLVDEAAARTGPLTGEAIGTISTAAYDIVFANKFDRNDELAADKTGIQLAHKAGYNPNGMTAFLNHLTERNKDRAEPSGLFASHPQIKERIDAMARTIKADRLTAAATVDARYRQTITFDAKPAASVAMADVAGVKAAVGGSSAKTTSSSTTETPPKEEPAPKKKKGFGLGSLTKTLTQGKQAESTQASASGGSRMGVPDTDAVGGPNKTPLRVSVTAAEVAEFKKGIV